MPDDAATLTQRVVVREVMSWCRAEGIGITRRLVRRLATPARPAETVVELDLDDTVVAVHAERIEVQMPHRVETWPYTPDEIAAVVAQIVGMLETG